MKVNNIQTIAASVILCLPCASSSSINGPAFVPSLVLSSSSANKLMKNVNGVSKSKSSTLLNVLPKDEQQDASPSRRSFLKKLTTSTGIITSATTFGTIGNFDMGDHGIACDCDSCSQPTASATSLHALGCDCLACAGAQVEGGIGQTEGQVVFDDNYSSGCACPSCRRVPTHRYGPAPAMAYETMDEDGIKRSPDYYAQIIQVRILPEFYQLCDMTCVICC